MTRPNTVLAMRADLPDQLFGEADFERLSGVGTLDRGVVLTDFSSPGAQTVLAQAEVLLTGWGCPPVDAAVLAAAPGLRAIVHAGGSIKAHVTPACWARDILVSTAAQANARPVAEYTLAMILLATKATHLIERRYRERRGDIDVRAEFPTIGNYQRSVGIIGASRVGRLVIELLRPFDVQVLVSDPYLDPAEASAMGVHLVELDDLLRTSDVVSLHAPALPSTRHLLDRRRLGLLRNGATFVNTARGSLVDEDALVDELGTGRINAVLDVTDPWVPAADSPLYTLPNVVLTPHMAGAFGTEVRRLGTCAIDELARYAAGQPFQYPVTRADLERIA